MKEHRRIYCANLYGSLCESALASEHYPYRLESYHYATPRMMERIEREGRQIFLDSGAFSAFTKGAQIDIAEYAKFIKRWDRQIEVASVLDGIGDPELTLRNQLTLEDIGVSVLPCFHYGEPLSYLERYLRDYEYITLGGMVPISTSQLVLWLNQIWGGPLKGWHGKVHGFGLTTIATILQYPWYSVDSTVWVKAGRFGSIIIPGMMGRGLRLSISDQANEAKAMDRHLMNLSDMERKVIVRQIKEKGFSAEALAADYKERDRWNILAMHDLMALPYEPCPIQPGLF
jgi:hypothetical protein